MFKKVALVYCDPNESPLVWDYRAREFMREECQPFFFLFVCHWSQLDQIDLLLSSFPTPAAEALPIDRCCKWWFDSPEVQAVVLRATDARIVDQPVSMTRIIRNRARYPHHNTCSC